MRLGAFHIEAEAQSAAWPGALASGVDNAALGLRSLEFAPQEPPSGEFRHAPRVAIARFKNPKTNEVTMRWTSADWLKVGFAVSPTNHPSRNCMVRLP